MQTGRVTYHVELVIREKVPRIMGLHGKPLSKIAGGKVWKHLKMQFDDRLAALQQLADWREENKIHDEFLFTNIWITKSVIRNGFMEDYFEF